MFCPIPLVGIIETDIISISGDSKQKHTFHPKLPLILTSPLKVRLENAVVICVKRLCDVRDWIFGSATSHPFRKSCETGRPTNHPTDKQ